VHFSVYWWRTLHQPPSVLKPGAATMPPAILAALLVNVRRASRCWTSTFDRHARSLLRAESEALA
jgi:heme exporter protein C